MKLSKIFLLTCVTLGVIGWTPAGGDFYFGILRPLSAVFFILFFASKVVEAAAQDHNEQTGTVVKPAVSRSETYSGSSQSVGAH